MSDLETEENECKGCIIYDQVFSEGVGCMLPSCIYWDDQNLVGLKE